MNDVWLSSPIWLIVITSLIPLTLKLFNGNQEVAKKWVCTASIVGLILSAGCLLYIWPGESVYLFSNTLALDIFRSYASLSLLVLALVVVLITPFHPQVDLSYLSETLFLYLNALAGLLALTWSNNLLIAFVSLELASMAFYLLIALGLKGRKEALFASFKYFVLGSLASAILLYGMAFVVGMVHHFDLARLLQENPELLSSSPLLALGVVFISAGFLFKVSVFPFQFWLPDVYRGSFTPLLILMAGGMKIAVFTLLYQWTKNLFSGLEPMFFLSVLQWMAVLSVLFGNILAVLQTDFKKMLLFSTVAHSGYLLMIFLSASAGSTLAPSGLLYYLMIYAAMTAGIFLCLLPLEKDSQPHVPLSHLKGLSRSQPLLAFFITIFLLSLAGIPPLGGFIAKLFLFHSLLNQGFWWLLFWAILGSAIAFYYYLKPVALLYMDTSSSVVELKKPSALITGIHISLTVFIIIMGVYPFLVEFN